MSGLGLTTTLAGAMHASLLQVGVSIKEAAYKVLLALSDNVLAGSCPKWRNITETLPKPAAFVNGWEELLSALGGTPSGLEDITWLHTHIFSVVALGGDAGGKPEQWAKTRNLAASAPNKVREWGQLVCSSLSSVPTGSFTVATATALASATWIATRSTAAPSARGATLSEVLSTVVTCVRRRQLI